MTITATHLRKNIYQVIDQVALTGIPVEITRKGQSVLLVPSKKVSKLARLKKRNIMCCPPEDIVHMDWSSEWKPCI